MSHRPVETVGSLELANDVVELMNQVVNLRQVERVNVVQESVIVLVRDIRFPGFGLVFKFRILEEERYGVHSEAVDALSVDPVPDDVLKSISIRVA